MKNKELIGHNLKNIRNQLGFKQKELAENLNISSGYLSEVEAGKKSPGIEVLSKLLEKYQVNPAYILTGEGDCFLSPGKRESVDGKKKPKEGDKYDAMVAEMLWYIEHIPVVGYAVFEFFSCYLYEKQDMIDKELKKIKKNNPAEKIPGSP
jgi:transcriptional regulator with XRE-family HTH domain